MNEQDKPCPLCKQSIRQIFCMAASIADNMAGATAAEIAEEIRRYIDNVIPV